MLNKAQIRVFEAIVFPFELRVIGFLNDAERSVERRQRNPDYDVEETCMKYTNGFRMREFGLYSDRIEGNRVLGAILLVCMWFGCVK